MAMIDHLVLVKVKPGTPDDKIETVVTALRALTSLDSVSELYAGPAVGTSSEGWTHGLYARFASKDALQSYLVHEQHKHAADDLMKPIMDDLCVVDWEGEEDASKATSSEVGVVHAILLKLKDGAEGGEGRAMAEKLRTLAGAVPGVHRLTVGENFATHVTKGFTWGYVVALRGGEAELRAFEKDGRQVAVMEESVRPVVGEHVVFNFATA